MNIVKAELFDYKKNIEYLEKLSRSPYISIEVIGRTSLDRGIFSLTFGNRKNSVLLAAGFHGCEWITCLLAYRFIEELCDKVERKEQMCSIDVSAAFKNLGLTVVPCVNPDGTEIARYGAGGAKFLRKYVESIGDDFLHWNANAKGVDINHNFDAGWDLLRQMEIQSGITGPSSRQYGGPFAESETETKSLTRLCRLNKFRQVMALHSQGEEIYWQYGENKPAQSELIAKILADSCSYTLVENSALASHGGFKDWFIEEFSRPGFTMEVGKGTNPLPVSDFDDIYERIREALLLFSLC